jgi:aminoglycoside/choline kinase family phosphotransferase
MQARENALSEWLKTMFGEKTLSISPLAGDASFRRYFRLLREDTAQIIMDAPPPKEALKPFVQIAKALANGGIHTPAIHAVDYTQGFALLEDLGDELLLNSLTHRDADMLYKSALDTLVTIQRCSMAELTLPTFDAAFIRVEFDLFREWFIQQYLSITLSAHEAQVLEDTLSWLTQQIIKQPQVFTHRDYHSRNLMIIENPQPLEGDPGFNMGVIDFQDAVCGPFAYDLASLLKDCYIQWPQEQIIAWLIYFYNQLPKTTPYSFLEFSRAFDVCGLQRHLKVLGIFSRLHLRDNKPGYLRDLPLAFHYVLACLENYAELHAFQAFMLKIRAIFVEKQTA